MISIIIPIYNQHEMTADCIEAIRLCTTGEYEIVLVDNGSDPPIKKPYAGFVNVELIRNDDNKGFPVAVNQGVEAAKGDNIILLNNDVIVTPGWAEQLCAWFDEFGIVTPVTNYCAGMQRVSIQTYENTAELNKEAAFYANENAGRVEEVNWVIGFCMAFKKSLWDSVGPFDESLWPCSGEEIDFCLKARHAGHRIAIVHSVYVHHFGSKTFIAMEESGEADYNKIVERNNRHLAEKWGSDFWQRQSVMSQNGIRLNLGSGPFPLPGFINVDQFENVKPDLVADALHLPYEPGTVSEIYAGHILEHFMFDDGQKALRYWLMLLKPGGVISVVVPDYDFLIKQYMAAPTPERLIKFNDLFIYSGIQPSPHQYAYSAALLEKVMKDAGFVNLERMPGNHPYLPKVDHPDFPYGGGWQVGFQGVKP